VIFLCVDNDATRKIVYDALDEFPTVSLVVIDPGNEYWSGNVNTWMRITEGVQQPNGDIKWRSLSPFAHPRQKWKQLVEPADNVPGGGCSKQVESAPQLIVANQMCATLSLMSFINLLNNTTIHEEYVFDLRKPVMGNAGDAMPLGKTWEEISAPPPQQGVVPESMAGTEPPSESDDAGALSGLPEGGSVLPGPDPQGDGRGLSSQPHVPSNATS
jgi:hypothetical protein